MDRNHIQSYLDYLRIEKGLCENTVTAYKRDVLEFEEYVQLPFRKITRSHIRGFLSYLDKKGNQPVTRRRKLTALKTLFFFLKDNGIVSINSTEGIAMIKVREKESSYLTEKEIAKFLHGVKCDTSRFRERNMLMARIFVEAGVRLSELTQLNVSDVVLNEGSVHVKRKGGREQDIPINNLLIQRLKKFVFKKARDEPLFESSYGRRITQRRVGILMKSYLRKADIQKDNLSCHSLRHSYCSRLLEKGVNIRSIQVLAGHRNIATTERYLHIAESKLRKDAEMAMIRDYPRFFEKRIKKSD